MMMLKIVMAHLWKGILKRKIIEEIVSGEQESHTQTLKKPSHLSHNKVKYIQICFHCQTGIRTGLHENIL